MRLKKHPEAVRGLWGVNVVLQAYCKLIVALLAAGCVHGFVHAEK